MMQWKKYDRRNTNTDKTFPIMTLRWIISIVTDTLQKLNNSFTCSIELYECVQRAG